MFGSVAGGGQGLEPEAPEVDLLSRDQSLMRVAQLGATRRDHPGAPSRQLPAAGDEVGIKVRLGGQGDRQAAPLRLGEVRTDVARRVHHHGRSIAQVDQVRTVAQSLLHQGHDVGGAHRRRPQPWPTATGSPACFHSKRPSSSRKAT